MNKTFLVGDIHGAYKALKQVLERSKFDYEKDTLIIIGDVCDGWPETKECVDELLKIKNRIFVVGNHDLWMIDWIRTGDMPYIWVSQGGKWTIKSYGHQWYGPRIRPTLPDGHEEFWKSSVNYHLTDDSRLFVHGGYHLAIPIEHQTVEDFAWDRSLWDFASLIKVFPYEEVFIGHTTTERESLDPVKRHNVWNVDQGAGWGGRLTLIDIETKEFWSSDLCKDLYTER